MKNEPESFYKLWLRKAEEDEFAAEKILEEERFPAPACFHFQQMAEKYLKALLVFRGHTFRKVHDLLRLELDLQEMYPDIAALHKDLDSLNRYYTETRYPGDYPEFTLAECREAREAALRVKRFVLGKIS